MDAVQSGTVHCDLVINLVSLPSDTVNVNVLVVHFLAHGPAESIQAFGSCACASATRKTSFGMVALTSMELV